MKRRDFLKALGFTLVGLPLAGKPILEPDEVGEVDLDGTDAELPEESVEQEFTDNPYSCYDQLIRACCDINTSFYIPNELD